MKKKVTITATDRIGRKESITMILSEETANCLKKAAQQPDDYGEENDYNLLMELNEIYESYEDWQNYPSKIKEKHKPIITKSQYYKLKDFYRLIYHKFYKYTLSIYIY